MILPSPSHPEPACGKFLPSNPPVVPRPSPPSGLQPVRLLRPGTGTGTGATSKRSRVHRAWYDGTPPDPQVCPPARHALHRFPPTTETDGRFWKATAGSLSRAPTLFLASAAACRSAPNPPGPIRTYPDQISKPRNFIQSTLCQPFPPS